MRTLEGCALLVLTSCSVELGDNTHVGPPATALTVVPSDPSNDSAPTFEFTSNEAGDFLCNLDSSPYASCTSPFQAPMLADGEHRFVVMARDVAGVFDPAPPQYEWRISTSRPVTTITASPNPQSYVLDATLEFSAVSELPVTFGCSLDGAPFELCTSPLTLQGLSDDSHTFQVSATDLAGNTDSIPASYAWRAHIPWQVVASDPDASVGDFTWAGAIGSTLYITTVASSGNSSSVAFDTLQAAFGAWSANLCACGYTSPLVESSGQLFNFTDVVVAYDPTTQDWTQTPSSNPDGEAGVADLGGVLYFAGGRNTPRTVRTYTVASRTWSTVADYPLSVYDPALATYGGRVFGFGGIGPVNYDRIVKIYDPISNSWTSGALSPLPFASSYSLRMAQTVGDRIYVAASSPPTYSWALVVYDPSSDTWDTSPIPLPTEPAWGEVGIIVADGTLYLIGNSFVGSSVELTIWKLIP